MTKSNYQILMVDCETNEQIFRNANADEIAQQKIEAQNAEIAKFEAEAKAQAKAAAQAKLAALGLTVADLEALGL